MLYSLVLVYIVFSQSLKKNSKHIKKNSYKRRCNAFFRVICCLTSSMGSSYECTAHTHVESWARLDKITINVLCSVQQSGRTHTHHSNIFCHKQKGSDFHLFSLEWAVFIVFWIALITPSKQIKINTISMRIVFVLNVCMCSKPVRLGKTFKANR